MDKIVDKKYTKEQTKQKVQEWCHLFSELRGHPMTETDFSINFNMPPEFTWYDSFEVSLRYQYELEQKLKAY
jgi:hypothetical protein